MVRSLSFAAFTVSLLLWTTQVSANSPHAHSEYEAAMAASIDCTSGYAGQCYSCPPGQCRSGTRQHSVRYWSCPIPGHRHPIGKPCPIFGHSLGSGTGFFGLGKSHRSGHRHNGLFGSGLGNNLGLGDCLGVDEDAVGQRLGFASTGNTEQDLTVLNKWIASYQQRVADLKYASMATVPMPTGYPPATLVEGIFTPQQYRRVHPFGEATPGLNPPSAHAVQGFTFPPDYTIPMECVHSLQMLIFTAGQGAPDAIDKISAVGLTYPHLVSLSLPDQFSAMIEQIRKIPEPDRRVHLVKIFGVSGVRLTPHFNAGASGIAKLHSDAQLLAMVQGQHSPQDYRMAPDFDSLSAVAESMQCLQLLMQAAGQGTQDALDRIGGIGFTYQQLGHLSTADQFSAIVDRLGQLHEPERSIHAVNIFGPSALQLLPHFDTGATGIAKLQVNAQYLVHGQNYPAGGHAISGQAGMPGYDYGYGLAHGQNYRGAAPERIVYIPFAMPPPIHVEKITHKLFRPITMRQVLGDAKMYEYPEMPLNMYTTRGPRDFFAANPPGIGY